EEFLQCLRVVLGEVPWDEEMACVISGKHYERLEGLCEGKVERFGEDEVERRYLAPRLLSDVDWEHPAMKEEIFGPVLPVAVFRDEEELVDGLRKLENPLAVYCFSKDQDFVEKVAGGLPSGSLCVNDTMKQFSQLNLPLGGVGQSGHGRYRGRHGVEAFSYEKSVTKRYFFGKDLMELMPPYEKAYRWIKKFMR
ncbi:aldehyde dehydrogenase family protein, partial [Akkermansiaceae bacterium]|nr:aldehyde dehydrogenase family protein [Akkermansiaceae bacterium]